jgi:hypothetical protein
LNHVRIDSYIWAAIEETSTFAFLTHYPIGCVHL